MTYRELLDKLQMMAELEPVMLNREVMANFEDYEYFTISDILIEPLGNQFHNERQPLLNLSS